MPKTKAWPERPFRATHRAIVEMKHRNPKFGCVRIAQQIAHAFGIEIDKDVVRRVLAKRFRPEPGADGPSWLTLIAHAKDSVWSVDLFRVESILFAKPLGDADLGRLHSSHHRVWHRPRMH
jgi:putative transposase